VEGAVDCSALNPALHAIPCDSASKGQYEAGLGAEDDVLLIDGAFKAARLARAFEMAGEDGPILLELDVLRRSAAVRVMGVDGPVPGDVGWLLLRGWLLGQCSCADDDQQKSEAKQKRSRFVCSVRSICSHNILHGCAALARLGFHNNVNFACRVDGVGS